MDIQDIVGLLGSLDPEEVTDVEFAKYAAHSQALMPRLDDTQKLILYGLYKQASVGNAPEKPGDIDKASPDYYKWQAWRSFVNVTGNDARRLYVYFVNQFQQVSEISSAGKSSGRDIEGVGSSVSTLFVDYSAQETEAFASSPLLRAVYAGNETDLKEILSQSADKINEKDSAGMTALHYAVDKGLTSIVDALLEHGADVNAQDETGQTPLMYAVICSHKEVVEKLLSVPSIDLGIKNTDGETAKDIAATGDDDILELLEKKP